MEVVRRTFASIAILSAAMLLGAISGAAARPSGQTPGTSYSSEQRLLDHRDQNNRKVTQMAVAHQALTNFVWGLLLLALLGGVYGIRVRPSDDLVETLKKNHELQEMLRGPQGQPGIAGPRGEPGPVGPKGDPSR